jgi:siroheme synthase-like protein
MKRNYFPCGLNVKGRACLVVGSDREAIGKTEALVNSGARVTLVADNLPASVAKKFRANGVRLVARGFKLSDLGSSFLVVFCLMSDSSLTKKVAAACRAKRILLCAIDQPAYCDVVNVSVVQKGFLTIAIGTDGVAPGVSRKIREGLEASLKNVPVDRFLKALARLRKRLEWKEPASHVRREKNLKMIKGFSFNANVALPKRWDDTIKKEMP